MTEQKECSENTSAVGWETVGGEGDPAVKAIARLIGRLLVREEAERRRADALEKEPKAEHGGSSEHVFQPSPVRRST